MFFQDSTPLPAYLYRTRYGILFSVLLAVLFAILVMVCWPVLPDRIFNRSTQNPAFYGKSLMYSGQILMILLSGSLVGFISDGKRSITPTGIKVFRAGSMTVGAISMAWAVGFAVVLYDDVTRSGAMMDPKVITGLVIVVLVCVGLAALDSLSDE